MEYNYLYDVASNPFIYNSNNEITFSVDSKIVAANDQPQGGSVKVTFQTNENMVETDRYILQLKFKEVVLAEKPLSFNKSMSNYKVDLKSNVTVANGGMLSVDLYKISQYFIDFYATNSSNIKIDDINTKMVMNWTSPRGEIIVIQKPSNSLQVDVSVDKTLYSPGDAVNYEVTVRDRKT